ncbi:MAG: cupin [Chloroflexota bacterium]|nr:cupin [Chloroflexota bacterium]
MTKESGTSTILAGPPLERIAKPWGEELILKRTARTVVKALRIGPHRRLSLQFHRRKHETLMLLSGEAELTFGPSIDTLGEIALREDVHWEIDAGVLHRICAGPSGADILEIASRLPDDVEDIVRLADDYGRVDTHERV